MPDNQILLDLFSLTGSPSDDKILYSTIKTVQDLHRTIATLSAQLDEDRIPENSMIRIVEKKLDADLREAARTLDKREARFLVSTYYNLQENRIRLDSQVRQCGEPAVFTSWMADIFRSLEDNVRVALDVYSSSHPVGVWARSKKGVGPVIAAGLLAHLDIYAPQRDPNTKDFELDENGKKKLSVCEHPGSWMAFCGLAPNVKWGKGEKRPWNADLKSLVCFKLGESFVKTSGGEKPGYYGKVYKARKALEIERNESGLFREIAHERLKAGKIDKSTVMFKSLVEGKLPPAWIHARARRKAVKLFLSHFHEKLYEHEFGKKPQLPYVITHLGHVDFVSADETY